MLDFRDIPQANLASGQQDMFEFFAQELLESLGYTIIEGPSRGSDGGSGKDLIVEEEIKGVAGTTVKIKWLVSCKHKAHSGRSVTHKDEQNLRDRIDANRCTGFIGFYSTIVSSGLQMILDGLASNPKVALKINIFNPTKIESLIVSTNNTYLAQKYFEKSYNHVAFNSKEKASNNLTPSFQKVNIPFSVSKLADKFFDGFVPEWSDLNAGFDIERDVYRSISSKIDQCLKEPKQYPVAFFINGVAGSGKTTLLRRVAFDLSKKHKNVYYLNSDWNCDEIIVQHQIKEIVSRESDDVFICIDNISFLISSDRLNLDSLLQVSTTKGVYIFFTDRPEAWNFVKHKVLSLVTDGNFFVFNIHSLSQLECERLLDKMIQLEENEQLTIKHRDATKDERMKFYVQDSKRHFVVIMFQIRYGQNFKNIILSEYERLPDENIKHVYELVSLFNSLGINLPEEIVLKAVYDDAYYGYKQFQKYLTHMLEHYKDGLSLRHRIISREIFEHVYQSKEVVLEAMKAAFSCIDLKDKSEADFVSRFLSVGNAYKKIVRLFARDRESVLDFIETLKALFGDNLGRQLEAQFYSFYAMCEILFKETEEAKFLFWKIVQELDRDNVFAHRQLAWLEHNDENWDEASKLAIRAAELRPNESYQQHQTAKLLSLNTVSNFELANQYFSNAKSLSPEDPKITKDYENYLEAKKILSIFSGLHEEDFIPQETLKALRPGLTFFRYHFGTRSKEYKGKLMGVLSEMEENSNGEQEDLFELVEGINMDKDKKLKSKYMCNLGRIMYLEWYHNRKLLKTDEIKSIFYESISLNPDDPFPYCWLGTYYKEVEKNYKDAEIFYKKSISISEKSKYDFERDNPLFFNNYGLFIVDKILLGKLPKENLCEAKNLLSQAVNRNKSRKKGFDFYWAEYNLDYCNKVIADNGVICQEAGP